MKKSITQIVTKADAEERAGCGCCDAALDPVSDLLKVVGWAQVRERRLEFGVDIGGCAAECDHSEGGHDKCDAGRWRNDRCDLSHSFE